MENNYLKNLYDKIVSVKEKNECKAPGNTFFMGDDKVLCCERDLGESRFPYSEDGLVVWLHSTGYIDACESTFTIFRPTNYGEESAVQFFGGIKNDSGYAPVSITGAGRSVFDEDSERYTVYSLKSAVSLVKTPEVIFACRTSVDCRKKIHFTLFAENTGKDSKDIYLASFIEAILRNKEHESFFEKMSKFGRIYENGTVLMSKNNVPDALSIKTEVTKGSATYVSKTVARSDYLGQRGLTIGNALSLKNGKFSREITNVTTTDLPCDGEIFGFSVASGESVRVDYVLTLQRDAKNPENVLSEAICADAIDKEIEESESRTKADYDSISIEFDGWNSDKIDSETFNRFLRSVQNQTSFCAHGKNYAGAYLGIRDVFQQLEAALIWQPDLSREKILVALNMILTTGRPPRMFSVPASDDASVPLDLEKYIDQGSWIIATLYTYLAYTGDYSILKETCRYLDAPDEAWIDGHDTGERTSVLEHLVRITDFLLSNIDTEYTGCLKVLFGDWNDAVDGLGRSSDGKSEFGTGVTVMATLQLRKNLMEMTEILKHEGEYLDKLPVYASAVEKMEEGLMKYAVDCNEKGERRIVHGWGDKVSYKVGSFNDPDGTDRYSLTSNAFFAISDFVRRDPSLKDSIMNCVDAVSSKYGLKTFDKPFPPDAKGVGRIVNIVPGTYENSCAYAHGSLFGVWGLFKLGESRRAWEEIEKTVVITHDNATMTSFVMPNSYCENEEYQMDGESLGDWHTGSGCVLMKELIAAAFGIVPTLEGITIAPASYFPSRKAKLSLNVKGCRVNVEYENCGRGEISTELIGANGEKIKDDVFGIDSVFIPNSEINGEITYVIKA